jgi:hypothetical protein
VGEGPQDPADSLGCFVEVSGPEGAAAEQPEQVLVHVGADGFHEVQGEGVAAAFVHVKKADAGVKACG